MTDSPAQESRAYIVQPTNEAGTPGFMVWYPRIKVIDFYPARERK